MTTPPNKVTSVVTTIEGATYAAVFFTMYYRITTATVVLYVSSAVFLDAISRKLHITIQSVK